MVADRLQVSVAQASIMQLRLIDGAQTDVAIDAPIDLASFIIRFVQINGAEKLQPCRNVLENVVKKTHLLSLVTCYGLPVVVDFH